MSRSSESQRRWTGSPGRTTPLLIAVAVAAALLGASFLLLQDRKPAITDAPVSGTTAKSPADRDLRDNASTAVVDTSGEAGGTPSSAELAKGSPASAESAISEAVASGQPTLICGKVVQDGGGAIPDAEVRWVALREEELKEFLSDPSESLQEEASSAESPDLAAALAASSTRTAADGSFELRATQRTGVLVVSAPGFATKMESVGAVEGEEVPVEVEAVRAGVEEHTLSKSVVETRTEQGVKFELTIVLVPGAGVSGKVVDAATRAGAEGMVVEAHEKELGGGAFGFGRGESAGSGKVCADGSYVITGLPAGDYTIRPVSGESDFITLPRKNARNLTIFAGTDATGVDFNVQRGGSISGTIRDSKGKPIENVGAMAFSMDFMSNMMSGEEDPAFGPDQFNWKSDVQGHYRIRALRLDSEYRVLAKGEGFAVAQSEKVKLTKEDPDGAADLVMAVGSRISGIVRDSGGVPAAEVGVFVQPATFDFASESFFTTILSLDHSIKSQESGEFVVEHLNAGSYRLSAGNERSMAFGMQDGGDAITVDGTSDVTGVELVLEESSPADDVTEREEPASNKGTISGRVVDDLGQPIAEADVSTQLDWTPGMRATVAAKTKSDETGAFVLAVESAGSISLLAQRDGFSDGTTSSVDLGNTEVTIVLQRHAVITGRVNTADGAAAPGFKVAVESVRDDNSDEEAHFTSMMKRFAGGGDQNGWVAGGANGTFRIENVPAGRVVVKAAVPGFAMGTSEAVTVAAGSTVTGVTVYASRGATVHGVVTAKGIGAIEGASARLLPVLDDPSEDAMAQFMPAMFQEDGDNTTTAADGVYELARLAPGSYRLQISHEEYAPADPILITLAQDQSFAAPVVELVAGGKIEGVAYTKSKESPRSGAMVQLMSGKGPNKMATTDKDGRFSFEGLASGDYTVVLVDMASAMSGAPAMKTQTATITGSDTATVEFVYGMGYRIRGKVEGHGEDEMVVVQLRKPGGPTPEEIDYSDMKGMMDAQKFQAGMAFVQEDGTYNLADIEPGKYFLEVPVMPDDPTDFKAYQEMDKTPRFRKEIEIGNEDVDLDILLAPPR